MRYELFLGQIIWTDDIPRQAYGLRAYNADLLRAGRFPLWTPSLWGGFPILADSFVEPLYPLNLLLLPVQPTAVAIVALYTLSVLIAGLGAYLLVRSLGLSPLAAFAGGVTYMLSGFMVTQVLHLNVLGCAIWLPLMCWTFERALQTRSRRYVALGAVLVCVELFGGHVQTGVLALLGLALYAGLRIAVPPAEALARHGAGLRGLARRALQGGAALGAMSLLGLALSAVQMVPFAELFSTSGRTSTLWSYAIAGTGSLAPFQLITLIIPYFFRLPPSGTVAETWGWGYIFQNELYAYLGAPAVWLAIAAVALPHRRRRLAVVIALAALATLVAALGVHTPVYRLIYNIPVLHNTRIPGRYLFLFALCTALLAALGLQALQEAAPRGRAGRALAWAAAVTGPALAALALLGAWLVRAYPAETLAFLNGPARLSPEMNIVPSLSYDRLVAATALGRFDFYFPLVLWALTAAAVVAWYLTRARRGGRLALAGLLAGAALYGADFLPRSPVTAALAQVQAVNGAVADRLAPGSLERVFSAGYGGQNPLDANIGMAADLPETTGYTLVLPARLKEFSDHANSRICSARLLTLWGVRYIWQRVPDDWRTAGPTGFSVQSPAFIGRLPDYDRFAFVLPAGLRPARIALLSAVAAEAPPSTPVGELLVEDRAGVTQRYTIHAGSATGAPPVLTLDDGSGREIYAADFALASTQELRRVELRVLAPGLTWYVYGLALVDADGRAQLQLRPYLGENCHVRIVYRDGLYTLLENDTPGPRAFLVNQAIAARDPDAILPALESGDIDLARTAVTEGLDPQRVAGSGPAGEARIVAYGDAQVAIDVQARTPALLVLTDWIYPGWKATVDGRPAEIYAADYIFRGVPVPAGAHRVEFTYDPLSFRLGVAVSVSALILTLLLLWREKLGWPLLGAWLASAVLVTATVVNWADLRDTWDASAALAAQTLHELQARLPDPAPGTRFYLVNMPFQPGPSWALTQPWLSRLAFAPVYPGRGVSGADLQVLGDYRDEVRPPWEATPGMIAVRYADGTFALTPYYFGQHSGYRLADLLPVQGPTQAPQAVFGDWLELHGSAIITGALNIDEGRLGGHFLETRWLLRRRSPEPYTLFVHFIGPDGQIVAQADHMLSVWTAQRPDGMYLDEWPAGVVIREYVALPDAAIQPTQTLQIRAGVWRPDTGEHLPVTAGTLALDEHGRLVLRDIVP